MLSIMFYTCTPAAAFLGMAGVALSLIFSCVGSAYGIAKAGAGLGGMGIDAPHLFMKNLIPVIMAGVLGIYGLIVSIILIGQIKPETGYANAAGYAHFSAGLVVGLSCLASGLCIGVVGEATARANQLQPEIYSANLLVIIFAEAVALFGLIIGLLLTQVKKTCTMEGAEDALRHYRYT